uniref:Uncharacterized protein n=1 Tax=Oryza meridionalis TaxID=40149 RepID=A0A0E0CW40_9ORYZ
MCYLREGGGGDGADEAALAAADGAEEALATAVTGRGWSWQQGQGGSGSARCHRIWQPPRRIRRPQSGSVLSGVGSQIPSVEAAAGQHADDSVQPGVEAGKKETGGCRWRRDPRERRGLRPARREDGGIGPCAATARCSAATTAVPPQIRASRPDLESGWLWWSATAVDLRRLATAVGNGGDGWLRQLAAATSGGLSRLVAAGPVLNFSWACVLAMSVCGWWYFFLFPGYDLPGTSYRLVRVVKKKKSFVGWRAVILDRMVYGYFWNKACMASFDEIMVHDPSHYDLLSKLGDGSAGNLVLMNLSIVCPTLSIAGDNVVHNFTGSPDWTMKDQ